MSRFYRCFLTLLISACFLTSLSCSRKQKKFDDPKKSDEADVTGPSADLNSVNPGAAPTPDPDYGIDDNYGNQITGESTQEQLRQIAAELGMSPNDLAVGKAYLEGWDGAQDEIPFGAQWKIVDPVAGEQQGTSTGAPGPNNSPGAL